MDRLATRRDPRGSGSRILGALCLAASLAVSPGANAASGQVGVAEVFGDGVICPSPSLRAAPAVAVPLGPDAPISMIVPFDGPSDLQHMRWPAVVADPLSVEIPFEVRAGVVGLTIRAQTNTPDVLVSVELLDEFGKLLSCFECGEKPAMGEVRNGRGTVQMPSTNRDGWELDPGSYSFRVRAMDLTPRPTAPSITVDVIASFRTQLAPVVEHFLDLNFVYLPGSTLSEEIATTDPHFAALLDTIDEYMEPTGIRVGNVTHVELDLPEYGVIATWEEVGELFRKSKQFNVRRALNVFCVEGFEAPLNPVVGLAGGIPGPAHNGTRDSGIAIRTEPLFRCIECLPAFGSLFAHEIGHYLGFYHTSETNLETYDPFDDTPECMEDGLGSCPDWFYAMFPVIHVANTLWSPAQAEVAWRHPLVRSVPVIGGGATRRSPGAGRPLALSPNPFRSEVTIQWDASHRGGPATVDVHDIAGRRVTTLTGVSGLRWDGTDRYGAPVGPGIYFVRLRDDSGAWKAARVVKMP